MTGSLSADVRRAVKTGCAAGLHWTGLSKLAGSWRGVRKMPLVVGYHRVVEDFERSDALSISPMLTSVRTFEQHLDWIGQRYRFVSLDELAVTMEQQPSGGKPVAAVTFDDGYRDVYQNALPVLTRKGIPSAVFVVTDLVGTEDLPIHDELHLLLSAVMFRRGSREGYWRDLVGPLELAAPQSEQLIRRLVRANGPFPATRAVLETMGQAGIRGFMEALRSRISLEEHEVRDFRTLDWRMLDEMISQGMTVGSHTRSHPLLAGETPATVRDELQGSRRALEERLGVPVRHFAYPDGKFTAATVQAVAEAGYHTAYTICAHRDQRHPLLTISRMMLWERACMNGAGQFSPAIMGCQVNGIFDPAAKCQVEHWA